jgi:hypothetical protein
MVSVLIPVTVWRELGGKADRFVGKVVEVDGTPHLVQSKYINITITVATQLRLAKP